MLGFLSAIPIRRRLVMVFTVTTTIALVAMSLLSLYYFGALVARDQAVKTAFAAQQEANDQLVSLQRMNALVRTRLAQVFATTTGSPIQGDPSLSASGALTSIDILSREINFEQTLHVYQANYALATAPGMSGVRSIVYSDDPASGIGTNQQKALAQVINADWPAYRGLQDHILQLLDPTANPTLVSNPYNAYEHAYALLFQANTDFLTLTNDWQQVVDSSTTIGEIVTNVGPSQYNPIIISTSIALICTILVVILAAYAVKRTITNPLRQLAILTQRIEKGENHVRAAVWGHDEIASVARSMNRMLDAIVGLIEQSESQRASLQFQVEKLMHDVSGISQGDLRVQVDLALPDLAQLASSFNFMLKAFSSLVRNVKRVAYEVVTSTKQFSEVTTRLVQSAEQQSVLIQSASEEVERMATVSKRTAQRAQAVSHVATQAREAAQQGLSAVQQTVKGVEEMHTKMHTIAQKAQSLYKNSSAMTEISSIMENIAQRSQRLALDAAIQVQMPPANGEGNNESNAGFAQVVKEIRMLAEQAKMEATRIKGYARTVIEEIAEVQHATLGFARETEKMATLAVQTGNALEATFLAVTRQADEIQEIAQVIGAQVPTSQEVVLVMQRVLQATRQSSDVTKSTFGMVQRQGQLVLHLRASVEAFKVQEEQSTPFEQRRDAVGTRRSGNLREENHR